MTKIHKVILGWETQAPDATFAGFTLAEFKRAVLPAFQDEERIKLLLSELTTVRLSLSNNSELGNEVALRVASAVRADQKYGINSPLYAAIGYVCKNKRKSGLIRKLKKAQVVIEAPAE